MQKRREVRNGVGLDGPVVGQVMKFPAEDLLSKDAVKHFTSGRSGSASYGAADKGRLNEDCARLVEQAEAEGYGRGKIEWPLTEFSNNAFQYLDKSAAGPAVALYWTFGDDGASFTIANRCKGAFNPLRYFGRSPEEIEDQVTGTNTHVGIAVSLSFASRIVWRFESKGGPTHILEAGRPQGDAETAVSAFQVSPSGERSQIEPATLDAGGLKADRVSVSVYFSRPARK